MEIFIKIAQFTVSISILVLIHELGHFAPAKLFKTRVEKFYLFFNPWFSLFKFKRGDTEYGIGWLPLGGYCKISGMIDESLDTEQLKKEPQPWEFRSKPTWQRLIIMLGGIIMNVLFGILIYIAILFGWGEKYLPTSEAKFGISCDSLAMKLGLKNGDRIISVDHKQVENFFHIPAEIVLNNAKTIQVIRNDNATDVNVPQDFIAHAIKQKNLERMIGVRIPVVVGGFSSQSPAQAGGVKVGDRIISINTDTTLFFDELHQKISKYKGENVQLRIVRKKDTLNCPVKVNDKGLIGISLLPLDSFFHLKEKKYGLLEAIPAGIVKAYTTSGNYLKQMKLLFSPETEAYKSLGGFISIGKIFPSEWDWLSFWNLTAFLSIILAIMNILPIPALDGGHVIFLFYEMIVGRKPSDKFIEYAQIVGMVILFGLLIFANGNDIIKLFK